MLVLICLSFSGCKKEIKLTENNIRKYLSIKAEYERIDGEPVYAAGVRLTDGDKHFIKFKIKPVRSGTFENVTFDVKCYIFHELDATLEDDAWYVHQYDPSYDENEKSTLAEKIELPTDGKYTGSKHEVIRVGEGIKDSQPDTETWIYNVKGTFIE